MHLLQTTCQIPISTSASRPASAISHATIVIYQARVASIRHVARMSFQRGMGMLASSHHCPPSECKHRVCGDTTTLPISQSPFCNTQHFTAESLPALLDCVQAISVQSFLPGHVAIFATLPYLQRHIYQLDVMYLSFFYSYLLQSLASFVILFLRSKSQPCLPHAPRPRCAY
jgi:hypothetical protein